MERVGAAQWGSAEVGASLGATPALRLMKRLTVTPIGTGSCCPTTSGARRCCDMDWSPPSFISMRPQWWLRDLIRYRTPFVRERATLVNRV